MILLFPGSPQVKFSSNKESLMDSASSVKLYAERWSTWRFLIIMHHRYKFSTDVNRYASSVLIYEEIQCHLSKLSVDLFCWRQKEICFRIQKPQQQQQQQLCGVDINLCVNQPAHLVPWRGAGVRVRELTSSPGPSGRSKVRSLSAARPNERNPLNFLWLKREASVPIDWLPLKLSFPFYCIAFEDAANPGSVMEGWEVCRDIALDADHCQFVCGNLNGAPYVRI